MTTPYSVIISDPKAEALGDELIREGVPNQYLDDLLGDFFDLEDIVWRTDSDDGHFIFYFKTQNALTLFKLKYAEYL